MIAYPLKTQSTFCGGQRFIWLSCTVNTAHLFFRFCVCNFGNILSLHTHSHAPTLSYTKLWQLVQQSDQPCAHVCHSGLIVFDVSRVEC